MLSGLKSRKTNAALALGTLAVVAAAVVKIKKPLLKQT
jgi:hypothetical protein